MRLLFRNLRARFVERHPALANLLADMGVHYSHMQSFWWALGDSLLRARFQKNRTAKKEEPDSNNTSG